MNHYQVELVRVEKFCELTGYTEAAVRNNRQKGIWLDGDITEVKNRRVHVNLRKYDEWVKSQDVSAVA